MKTIGEYSQNPNILGIPVRKKECIWLTYVNCIHLTCKTDHCIECLNWYNNLNGKAVFHMITCLTFLRRTLFALTDSLYRKLAADFLNLTVCWSCTWPPVLSGTFQTHMHTRGRLTPTESWRCVCVGGKVSCVRPECCEKVWDLMSNNVLYSYSCYCNCCCFVLSHISYFQLVV